MSIQLTTAERDLLDVANDAMAKLVASRKKQPRAALRTAIPATDYTPPDPYAKDLAAMRKDLPPAPVMQESPCPFEDPSYKTGNGSVPNSYAIALDRLKKGHQR
jgi:hypothetical protein